MRNIFFIILTLFILSTTTTFTQAQEIKPNAVSVQGGGSISGEFSHVLNLTFGYERLLLSKNGFHVGAQAGIGRWSSISYYDDLNVHGQHVPVGASFKKGLGSTHRHFIGSEIGYIYIHIENRGDLDEGISDEHHRMYGAFSYQYIGRKGFHTQLGLHTWQGLYLAMGFRF